MILFNKLVFNDFVSGTSPVYTSPAHNKDIGSVERLGFMVVVDQVSGASSLSVAIEHSGDDRNWLQKNSSPEISLQNIDATKTYVFVASDGGWQPFLANARLKITLSANVTAHVKIAATGRG